ncbi:MAG: arsenic metallochaperone ArsD family protein [Thermoanaerobaculia bacterium]
MRLLQIFEPPMCCSTGVCGTERGPVCGPGGGSGCCN